MSDYIAGLRELVGNRLLMLSGVAAIVRDAEGRVLFVREGPEAHWPLPGGGMEPGETPAEATVREVYEETGFDVVPERLVGVFSGLGFRHHYPNGHEVEWTGIVFECRHVGGGFAPMDGEVSEHRYFDVAEAPDLFLDYPSDLLVPRDLPMVQELEQVVVSEAHRPEPPIRVSRGATVTVLPQPEARPGLVYVRAAMAE
ncbi:MAG: NUDIX domain-containing protein, partial [Myxococcota bacterium]